MFHSSLLPQCCYPLIDHLLQGTNMMSPLTQTVDIIALKDASILAVSPGINLYVPLHYIGCFYILAVSRYKSVVPTFLIVFWL